MQARQRPASPVAARLALLEAHRRDVLERMREIERNLELIDYKIDLYRERLGIA